METIWSNKGKDQCLYQTEHLILQLKCAGKDEQEVSGHKLTISNPI